MDVKQRKNESNEIIKVTEEWRGRIKVYEQEKMLWNE